MSCTTHETGEGLTLRIDGPVTLSETDSLRAALLDAVGMSLPITVDLTGVTDVDTSGLQMLLSLQKTAEKRDIRLVLAGRQEGFNRSAERLGYDLGYYSTTGGQKKD